MLFSDIVGFTSICSTATPFEVITMLQNLYTKFDAMCGKVDVYKVSNMDGKLIVWESRLYWVSNICGTLVV